MYLDHRGALLRYLFSFGLSPQDGEEVVQEVFLALFQHLRKGKARENLACGNLLQNLPPQNLKGWIFRVGHNLALKRRTQSGRESFAANHQTLWRNHWDTAPGPEEQAIDCQRQARLLAAVRAMPRRDQSCLHLRAEGLRYREIAEALGISLGAVALSLGRSLARLSRADAR